MKTFDPDDHPSAGVPSPCISVCAMNPRTGLCDGCQRTIAEIVQWGSASDETKRAVWREIRRRRRMLEEQTGKEASP